MTASPIRYGLVTAVVAVLVPAGWGGPVAADPPAGTGPTTPHTTAASPGAPDLDDPVFPGVGNDGYDVESYRLALAYDENTTSVDGTVSIRAKATQNLSTFSLDAVGLSIESVRMLGAVTPGARAATQPATYDVGETKLVVTPGRPIPKRAGFTVTIEYSADPGAAGPESGWVPTDNGFALAPQPTGARTVFPCNDHPSDKADFTFVITAPPGLLGVATGVPTGETVGTDGSTTFTYASAHPVATEIVQVAVGDYTVVDRGNAGGVRLRDAVPTERATTLEPALRQTPGHLDWIEQRLGDFPLEAYGLLPVDTDDPDAFGFTGLETQTLTLYKPSYLEQSEDKIASHMMHEIVHSWFGNSVTPKDWSALWINEGHADLYGLMYRYERGWTDGHGYTTLEERMRYTYSQGDIWRATSGPVAAPDAETLFDNQRYTGATLVLYALREYVGAKTFDRIEREFLRRYRDRSASTDDFVAVATEVSGRPEVEGFLTDWLYGSTTPPMPNHSDWTVDPVPAAAWTAEHGPRTDRLGP